METTITKTNISDIKKTKSWKVKVWDIVKVEKKEYAWWVSLIWQVRTLNDNEIKIATITSDWWSSSIQIFTSKLDSDDYKLHFASKEEIETTIFEIKQQSLKNLQEAKQRLEEKESQYSNLINDLKIFKID